MIRLKNFRLLTTMVPFEYKDILDDLVWVAVCLGNLDVGLTSTSWKETIGSKRRREAEGEVEEEDGDAGAGESLEQGGGDSGDSDVSDDMEVDEGAAPVRRSMRVQGKAPKV